MSLATNTVKVIKNVASKGKEIGTSIMPASAVRAVNKMPVKQKDYFKSLGVKFSSLDESVRKQAESLVSDNLKERISNLDSTKVAFELAKKEGKDYGAVEDMHLLKAASILGTKLAMINREYGKIIGGISQLKDL